MYANIVSLEISGLEHNKIISHPPPLAHCSTKKALNHYFLKLFFYL